MGNIKQVLAKTQSIYSNLFDSIRIEVAKEGLIHFHWRDLRILLTKNQFKTLLNLIKDINWNEVFDGNDKTLAQIKIPDDIVFKRSLSVEEQMDGNLHFHYGDLRFELTKGTFSDISKLFMLADNNFHCGGKS